MDVMNSRRSKMKTTVYYADGECDEYESATIDLKHRIVIASHDGGQYIIPFENVYMIKGEGCQVGI